MTVVGYARVSTAGQSLDLQLERLHAAGCEKIFAEKVSGAKGEGPAHERQALEDLLEYVREGDVVIVTKLDRLGRSFVDVCRTVEILTDGGRCGFRVLDQSGIDTTSANGRLMLQLLAAFAEFETELRRERQLEGIARARAEGRYLKKGGRPKVDDSAIMQALAAPGARPAEVARRLKIGRTTLYRVMKRAPAGATPEQTDLEDAIRLQGAPPSRVP